MIKKWALLILIGVITGCCNNNHVEDTICKEEVPKLETLSNYPNSIVIDKSITDSGKYYYVTIKSPVYSRYSGIVWKVITIRVCKFEFEKCECGYLVSPNN